MADINRVVLVGRLTRDSELKITPSGQAVCKFSIAVNRSRKDGEKWVDEPNFFDVVLWGRQGEAISKYLIKGKSVGIDGELRQDRWQQEGQNRSKVEVVAANVMLLGGTPGGSSGSGEGGSYNNSSSGGAGSERRGEDAPAGDDGFADDIPF